MFAITQVELPDFAKILTSINRTTIKDNLFFFGGGDSFLELRNEWD